MEKGLKIRKVKESVVKYCPQAQTLCMVGYVQSTALESISLESRNEVHAVYVLQ